MKLTLELTRAPIRPQVSQSRIGDGSREHGVVGQLDRRTTNVRTHPFNDSRTVEHAKNAKVQLPRQKT
jgi:hypothetical protein